VRNLLIQTEDGKFWICMVCEL